MRRKKDGWIGVEKRGEKYRGYVWSKGVKKRTKPFATVEEAARERDRAALLVYGEIAELNFKDTDLSPEDRRRRTQARQRRRALDQEENSSPSILGTP